MKALVDNDIILKGACYGLLTEVAAAIPGDGTVGVLGATQFVITHRLRRYKLNSAAGTSEARLLTFLSSNEVVEPTPQEQEMAANLESSAQKLSLGLDVGESQLVAILIARLLPWFATGDKRAIIALERLFDADAQLAAIVGKIICLEQLVKRIVTTRDSGAIRRAICNEPAVDKTLAICFGCTSSGTAPATVLEGLESYIGALRADATRVLAT
jgi:hypothetical protein